MARVVMLTAAAGPGLNVQYGDVFETDQATADRLIELGSARPEGQEDKGRVAKRDLAPQVPATVVTQTETTQRAQASNEEESESDDASDEASEAKADPQPAAPRRPSVRRR